MFPLARLHDYVLQVLNRRSIQSMHVHQFDGEAQRRLRTRLARLYAATACTTVVRRVVQNNEKWISQFPETVPRVIKTMKFMTVCQRRDNAVPRPQPQKRAEGVPGVQAVMEAALCTLKSDFNSHFKSPSGRSSAQLKHRCIYRMQSAQGPGVGTPSNNCCRLTAALCNS